VDVSIIIVTWNSSQFIGECLDSIYSHKGKLKLEVLVVDNDSQDATRDIIREFYPRVILIENRENSGYARANNQGIAASVGKYVLLLNPDVRLRGNALLELFLFVESHPEAGAVGPQLLNLDGSIQPSCREFPDFSTLLYDILGLSYLFPKSRIFGKWRMGYFDHNSVREVDQPMASALILRRKALAQVGLLDEDFFMFFNDVDLCYRLRKNRWKIYFYPDAKAYHFLGGSTQKVKTKMIYLSHRGYFKFLKKHRETILDEILLVPSACLLFLTAVIRMLIVYVKESIQPSTASP
jgi:GT2 family glycosyltransferase